MGLLRSTRTIASHKKDFDLIKAENHIPQIDTTKLQGCSFDLRMCQKHKLDIKLYSVIFKFRHNNIRLHFLRI